MMKLDDKLTPEQLDLLTEAALAFKLFWNATRHESARDHFQRGIGLLDQLRQSFVQPEPPKPTTPAA